MSTTFENELVDVNVIFDTLLYPQIKGLIGLIILTFVIKRIACSVWPDYQSSLFSTLTNATWYMFKMFIYGSLAIVVFFFDFESKQFNWGQFPETMLLSTTFVGLLAIYEAVSNLIEIVNCLLKYFESAKHPNIPNLPYQQQHIK